jgi:transcriptional regulator GlxA family with amidase domain
MMKQEQLHKKQIIFLVMPNANMFDFSGSAQVFYEAIDQGFNAELKFCTFEEGIKASTSMPLGKIDSYKKIKPKAGDYIFIGSAEINYVISDKLNPGQALLDWLVNAFNGGTNICALCNGAFLLGKTGLLDGRECTTHFKRTAQLQKRFPFSKVQENILFVEDDRIITSAGATTGTDVALYVLNQLTDDYFTYKVSRELLIYSRRIGSNAQQSVLLNYRNHVHAGIHKVQDWLHDNLQKKLIIPELAEIAMMSERNFTRVFKKETSLTVNDYITLLRKEKIRELLKRPDLSRDQIAKQCGLQSTRHLSRLINLQN